MTIPTKEQWLSYSKEDKQKAVADALFLLDFIYKQANRVYRHTHAEGEIPHNKAILKTFLKNTYMWEKELETLSNNTHTENDD